MSETVVDYAPEPLAGEIVLRRSADAVEFTLRPTVRAFFAWLLRPLATWAVVCGMYLLLRLAGAGRVSVSVDGGIAAGLLFAVLVGMTLAQAEPIFFPIRLLVTASHFRMEWRSWTRANVWQWERSAVVDVQAKHTPVGRGFVKHWALVLSHKEGRDLALLTEPRKRVEVLATHLRAALGLQQPERGFLAIPAPPGCRWKRNMRAGTLCVTIGLPFPAERTVVSIGIGAAAAVVAWVYLGRLNGEDERAVQTAVRGLLAVGAGVGAGAGLQWVLNRIFRTTYIFADARGMRIMETGIVSPLNVEWRREEIASIEAVGDSGHVGRGSVRIRLARSPELVVLPGKRRDHLEWLVAQLQAATGLLPMAAGGAHGEGAAAGGVGAGEVGEGGAGTG